MDYSNIYFGKTLNDLTIEDVRLFFKQEKSETDQLEFKSIAGSASLKDRIPKIQQSVCAFLNSSGGLIIWGAPVGEKLDGKSEKVFVGDLTFFDTLLEKDFLISKISDSIIPLPGAIRVRIFSEGSMCMAVIEVDQSEYSPHQTENRYYMRIDGQSKPAPHHYIESLFSKIRYPNIEAYLKLTSGAAYGANYRVCFELILFNFSPLQNEEQLSFRVVAENGVFMNATDSAFSHLYRMNGTEFTKIAKDVFHYGEPVVESDSILFDIHKANENGNKARLTVTIGGRLSPLKMSRYVLDFSKYSSPEPDEMIIEKRENRLAKDIQDELGVTRESTVESFMKLKRKK